MIFFSSIKCQRSLNTCTLRQFSGSFCDKKRHHFRLQMIQKATNIKQIVFKDHSGVARVNRSVWKRNTITWTCVTSGKELPLRGDQRCDAINLPWTNWSTFDMNLKSACCGNLCIWKRVLYFVPSVWWQIHCRGGQNDGSMQHFWQSVRCNFYHMLNSIWSF